MRKENGPFLEKGRIARLLPVVELTKIEINPYRVTGTIVALADPVCTTLSAPRPAIA